MNCPNCGRPLAEGEVCNCINQETYMNQNPVAYAPQGAAVPPLGAPPQQPYTAPGAYYQPPQGAYTQPGATPLADVFNPVQTDIPARTDYPDGYNIKRKYAAVLLAWALGAFGIHNFYLGYKNKAVAQLLVATVGSLLFGLGLVAASVWAIIDAVQLLTDKIDKDADGFKIQTFEESLAKELNRQKEE